MATAAANGGLPPADPRLPALEQGRRDGGEPTAIVPVLRRWSRRRRRSRGAYSLVACGGGEVEATEADAVGLLGLGNQRWGGGSAGAGISLGPILPQREAAAARRGRGDRAAA